MRREWIVAAVQILDSSVWGLRSARRTFRSATSNVTVTLFPMIHLGEAAFYDAVWRDACAHDAVLVEGVRSPVTKRVTRAYRWIEGAKHIALVVQPHHPAQSDSQATIIHADLPGDEFEQHWRKVPLHLRLLLYAGALMYGLYYRWFGSRESLAEGHALDYLPSRDETLRWTPEYASLYEAILTERDRRLVEVMSDYLDSAPTSPRRLAIVYGAGHMRAVIKALTRRRFFSVNSEWMLVFPLEHHGAGQGRT
jgi:hypothetical protein